MACIFMSGAEWNTMHEMSQWGTWTNFQSVVSSVETSGGIVTPKSGNYFYHLSHFYGWFGTYLPGSPSEIYVQFAINLNELGDNLFHWYGNYGWNRFGRLVAAPSGRLLYYLTTGWEGGTGGVEYSEVRAASAKILPMNTWHVIELHIKSHPTDGIFEMRIDGALDVDSIYHGSTVPSVFAGMTCIDRVAWDGPINTCFDDIVINDVHGVKNISWPGCLKVILLRPNDNGDEIQWTGSAEPWNYDLINEVPPDATHYVSTSENGKRDLYKFQSLPSNAYIPSIVRCDAWAYKNSGHPEYQPARLAFPIKTAAGFTVSEPHNLLTSYDLVTHVWDENPTTGADFTVDEVNNLQAGIQSVIEE